MFLNLEAVVLALEHRIGRTEEEIRAVLEEEAAAIMERSQELVPKDTMELHDSAFVDPVREDGTGLAWVAIGYTARHAVALHERLDLQHAAGTQSKFLQAAADESVSTRITRRIAGRLNRLEARNLWR